MKGVVALFLAPILMLSAAYATEFVEVEGLLDDESFYRAVACGAEPEGVCARPFARWPADSAQKLTRPKPDRP